MSQTLQWQRLSYVSIWFQMGSQKMVGKLLYYWAQCLGSQTHMTCNSWKTYPERPNTKPMSVVTATPNSTGGSMYLSCEWWKEIYQAGLVTRLWSSHSGWQIKKGLYRWNWLPYGVASSPPIFQEFMDKILHGLNHMVWYLDDMLIIWKMDEQYLQKSGGSPNCIWEIWS